MTNQFARLWIKIVVAASLAISSVNPPRPHVLFAHAVQGSTNSHPLSKQRRGFIGLPKVHTISVQNTSAVTMPITVTFALSTGTVISQVFDSLAPESLEIYVEPPNFVGTGRVEGLADSLNDLNLFGVNFELSDKSNTAYLGLRYEEAIGAVANQKRPNIDAAGRSFLPIVEQTDGWQTEFILQNRSFSHASIVVAFYNPDGTSAANFFGVIPANGSLPIDLASVSDLPAGFIGSIVTASDQPVAVSSIQISNSGLGLRTSYPEKEDGQYGTSLVAPALFKANDLQTSRLCLQNAGSTDATVSIAYSDGLTIPANIKPGATACLDQGSETHAAGWSGGAVISSTQPLAAVVDVWAKDTINKPVGRWTYVVPRGDELAQKAVALPVLFSGFQQFDSTVYVYNPSPNPATLQRRFTAYTNGSIFCPTNITIPANDQVALSQSQATPFADVSAGFITSTEPIAVVIGMKSSKPLGTTQRNFGYQAAYLSAPVAPQKLCSSISFAYMPMTWR